MYIFSAIYLNNNSWQLSVSYFRLFITRSLSLHFSSSQIVSNIWEKGLTQLMIDNWVCREVKPIYRTKLCILYELRLDTVCSVLVVESWWELHAPSARHFPNGPQYISRCRSAHYPGPDKWIMINGGLNLETLLSPDLWKWCVTSFAVFALESLFIHFCLLICAYLSKIHKRSKDP